MLSRRLFVGFIISVLFLVLCYLDVTIAGYGADNRILWLPRGIILLPIYLTCLIFLTREVLRILNAAGLRPYAPTVYIGNLLIASSCWLANAYQQYKIDIQIGRAHV